jgi:hypothetical protein
VGASGERCGTTALRWHARGYAGSYFLGLDEAADNQPGAIAPVSFSSAAIDLRRTAHNLDAPDLARVLLVRKSPSWWLTRLGHRRIISSRLDTALGAKQTFGVTAIAKPDLTRKPTAIISSGP